MKKPIDHRPCAVAVLRPFKLRTHRPANVPQRHANQAMHARYATHARTFFPNDFVSVENKGSKIQLPKLKVASSSLVARSSCSEELCAERNDLLVIECRSSFQRRAMLPGCAAASSVGDSMKFAACTSYASSVSTSRCLLFVRFS